MPRVPAFARGTPGRRASPSRARRPIGCAAWRTVCNNGAEAQKMATVASLREHLVEELNDLLNAEQQLIEALPQMQEKASNRQLKAAFRSHLAQTRAHEKR